MAKPTIFISYSHKDEEWKSRLVTHLGVLQQQDYLDIWVDTRIEGGADWLQEIKEAIDVTSIAVLLISADFLNSKFITEKEIPMLLQQQQEKGLRIFPIILKPCDWLGITWVKQFMARPKDGRPLSAGNENQIETDLAAIAKEIRELLQKAGLPHEIREYVPLPPDQVSLSKLPTTQHALFGRDKELKLLDDAWQNPHCHVLSFVAFGGVGKTALVNEWLNQMELDNWRGAERVYGWSFYSQGTREDKQASADTFFEDALKFFGYTGEPLKSPWDKGKLLASLIKERKTLLILDGLEPLQHPPGVEEGRLRDQGLKALLKELARFNNGLCVITTRCQVADIETSLGKTAHCIELENLSPEAGRQLLREAGVTNGTDQELRQAAAEYDGHALALSLLGRYLAVRYGGEIRQRDTIKKLAYEGTRQGIHARHVMDSYEIWLTGTAELELLYLMGLFDRPAPLGAITALKQPPVIKGVTDRLQRLSDEEWDFAVGRLRDLRLLSASEADKLDCHPLIREHFSQKLKAKGQTPWRLAHERLYEYYKNLPEKELPDTLEEMEPLYLAVFHGSMANYYQEVFNEIFWHRIQREEKHFTRNTFANFNDDLAAFACFFERPWERIHEEISKKDKAKILVETGFLLRIMARLKNAELLFSIALNLCIKQKDWNYAARATGNLGEIKLTSGEIWLASKYTHESVKFADKSSDKFLIMYCRTALANIHHHQGNLSESELIFQEAEIVQREREPDHPLLYSGWGFLYSDLLLDRKLWKEVINRSISRMNWKRKLSTRALALDHLSLGLSYLIGFLEGEIEEISLAGENLNKAVKDLLQTGQQQELPRALFARAFYYRLQNQFPQAWDDLEEAREIAERGDLKLHLVDYHLEASRLLISEFGFRNGVPPVPVETFHEMSLRHETSLRQHHETSLKNAHDHLKQAADLVKQTKYHRRDPEVELGYAGLFFAQGEQAKAREHLGKAKVLLEKMGIRYWDFEVRRLEEAIG